MTNISIKIEGVFGILFPMAAIFLIHTIKEVAFKYLDNPRRTDGLPINTTSATELTRVGSSANLNTKQAVAASITGNIQDYQGRK